MDALRIMLHGVRVGGLFLSRGGRSTFRVDDDYLEMPGRPVLGRWYEDHLRPGYLQKSTHTTLPPFFRNYLPEVGTGLRELLAARAGVAADREFDLLEALGEDLPGAIVVVRGNGSAGGETDDASGKLPAPEGEHPGALRYSLAGVQLKLSVVRGEQKLTVPVKGRGGDFILKLPDRAHARVPENEYSTMVWARRAGITVPDVELVPWRTVERLPSELDFDEDLGLLVTRFDRSTDAGRIHQEDFAQVLGRQPERKYPRRKDPRDGATFGAVGNIIARVCGAEDFTEYLRRLAFVVLSGNADAHLKNWSLWYPDRRRPRLAPAYDLVSVCAYGGPDRPAYAELALPLAREWALSRITRAHFGKLAKRAGFEPSLGERTAEESAERIRAAWTELRTHLPMADEGKRSVDRHMASVEL